MGKLTEKQEKILKKVRGIEEAASYQERCLAAGVCPECGSNLVSKCKSVYACTGDSKCAFYGHFLS